MNITKTNDPVINHINDDLNQVYNNFIKEAKYNVIHPIKLIKKYSDTFSAFNTQFKLNVLGKENAKSGIFLHQYKNYNIAEYLSEKFKFTRSKTNRLMNYTKAKLLNVVLFEISLQLRHYNYIYPFMIQYDIFYALSNYFNVYSKDEITTWKQLFNPEDLTEIYDEIINKVDNYDIPNYTIDLDKKIMFTRKSIAKKINIIKPRCPEDLTFLFEDDCKQKDKYNIIAEYYKVSARTARRWMTEFNLIKEPTKNKHNKQMENTDDMSNEKINELEETIAELEQTNLELYYQLQEKEQDNTILKNKINDLANDIFKLQKENQQYKSTGMVTNETQDNFDWFLNNTGKLNIKY